MEQTYRKNAGTTQTLSTGPSLGNPRRLPWGGDVWAALWWVMDITRCRVGGVEKRARCQECGARQAEVRHDGKKLWRLHGIEGGEWGGKELKMILVRQAGTARDGALRPYCGFCLSHKRMGNPREIHLNEIYWWWYQGWVNCSLWAK